MELIANYPVRKTNRSALHKADLDSLEFGKYISDHMLVCDFANGRWNTPQILPFSNLSISPTALALHYGQTVFEGMKAFRMQDGRVNIFRLEKHYERFVRSLQRMCMAVVTEDIFVNGLSQLVSLDREWIPNKEGTSLYLRPFVYASEAKFGVKVASEYRFIIFTGPVPSIYARPVRVCVETQYVRAARGGTGAAKCGGNYGAAFLPTQNAIERGYDQVLWTDSKENKYIEESGMMNVVFVIDGKIVTPALTDSILDGITRDSLLRLARDMGYEVEERPVSVRELEDAFSNNSITEAFGAGTAAVVAPIALIGINGRDHALPPYTDKNIMFRLKTKLQNIRSGSETDTYQWNFILE